MNEPYKVLIVGAGKIAGGFDAHRATEQPPLTHAKAFVQHGGFKLSAVIEPDPEKRHAFCQRWHIPEASDSLESMRTFAGAFDVISICSTTSSHRADLQAAIALRPKLIFCEKPLTTSVDSSREAVKACDEAGILLAVAHLRRWAPDMVRLRSELRQRHWGALRSVQATYNKGVLNNGSHMLDLLNYLLGDLTVTAVGRPVVDAFPEDPSVPALLSAADALPIHLSIGDAGDYAHFEMQIIAEKGVIAMENGGARWRLRRVIDSAIFEGYRELDQGQVVQGEVESAFRYAIANIFSALSEDAPLSSTGHTALSAQVLCEHLRESALEVAVPHAI